jgi:type IV pilus assembly protein PilV
MWLISLTHRTRACGFTLVEVLVSVVVLALGLLGIANMQMRALGHNQSSYFRSQAISLANDIADRMRANPDGLASYKTTPLPSVAPTPNCVSADCDAGQMALTDLYQWGRSLATEMPNGTGVVTENNGVFTIAITWDDRENGSALSKTFNTSFQP